MKYLCQFDLLEFMKGVFHTLGFVLKKNQDQFNKNDQEIQELLTRKRTRHQVHLTQQSYPYKKEPFCLACSNLQCRIWDIQNEWWMSLAEKLPTMHWYWWPKGILWSFKSHIWSLLPDPSPIQSTAGAKLLTDKGSILQTQEHRRHQIWLWCGKTIWQMLTSNWA